METAAEYVSRWRTGRPVHLEDTEAAAGEERFFVGLRLMSGIRPDASEWATYAEPIERLIGNGLLERDGATLRLTARGVLVSNEVFQEFIA